jgi:3'-phosphoadenosine 5'-phosphosulfate sulfotransferase (PAPS reductase)/FAD synthetase
MDKFYDAVARVQQLFRKGHPCAVSWSGGKDSSAILAITLEAARVAKAAGLSPYVVVTHSDTLIENPEIINFVHREMAKIKVFAAKHGLEVDIRQAKPSLNSTWAVRVLSGRALPAFPGGNSDCSTDFKVIPMRKLRKSLFSAMERTFDEPPITVIGTRFSESATRGAAMRERGESWEVPVKNKDGDYILSAIADWETDDVWEFVGFARSGLIETYSDFDDLFRLYADGGGTSCAVVSDAIMEENASAAKKSGGCGARFGCWSCTRVANDQSMNAMIEGNSEQYGYMRGLNRFREYLIANHWDLNKRMWVGRSIKDGWIAIRPDTYSPEYCLDLLRKLLTIQMREHEAAYRLRIKPRFNVIDERQVAAIDALFSLQGYHKPFQAMREWYEIVEQGKRYDLPETFAVHPRTKMPEPRFYWVGDDWDEGMRMESGLRNIALEMVSDADFSGCMGTKTLKDGRIVMDVETADEFEVDAEGLSMAMDFEMEYMLERNEKARPNRGLTEGYRWWALMGTMALSPRQISMHDEILRRTAFKERHGIAGANYNLEDLLAKSVTKAELIASGKKAEGWIDSLKEDPLEIKLFSFDDVDVYAPAIELMAPYMTSKKALAL